MPSPSTRCSTLGIPVTVTNRIPTNGGAGIDEGSVVLADFDQQAIRVVARDDAAPLDPSAVIVLRGVTT